MNTQRNKFLCILLALVMVVSMFTIPNGQVMAATKTIYVTKGEKIKVLVKKATSKTAWKNSKKKVAKITSSKGKITIAAKAKGTTVLSAKIGKKTHKFRVVVEVPVMSRKSVVLKVGQSSDLKVNGTKRAVTWKSSDTSIAGVNKKTGTITAKAAGTAKITAAIGKKKYYCNIKVEAKDSVETSTNPPVTQQNSQQVGDSQQNTQKPTDTQEEKKVTMKTLYIDNKETGNKIYGRIYTPAGTGKHPAVILSHGYNGHGADFTNECKYYAQNGYIAYAFDFCGGSASTLSTGKSTDMTIFTEKSDLLSVFDYIYGLDEVDQDHVYLFGGSQGGLVTALATEERSDKVKAMAMYFPALCIPDDWRKTYPDVEKIPETKGFWGLTLGKNFFVSIHDFHTFDHIGKYDKNVLIVHGDKDVIAPLSYSQEAEKVYPNGKLIVMSGEGHGFTPEGGKKAMQEVLRFMEENK